MKIGGDRMRLIDADALKEQICLVGDCTQCKTGVNEKVCKWNMVQLNDAVERLESAPTIDAMPRWIPCEERLPDELEEVNVTWVNHKPKPYYDFVKDKPFTASAVYYKGDWYWYSSVCADLLAERGENEIDKIDGAIEITAWMPLPEPYEGERKDDD